MACEVQTTVGRSRNIGGLMLIMGRGFITAASLGSNELKIVYVSQISGCPNPHNAVKVIVAI